MYPTVFRERFGAEHIMLLMDDDDSGWALMPVNFTRWDLHTLGHFDTRAGVTFLNEANGKRGMNSDCATFCLY